MPRHRLTLRPCTAPPSCNLQPLLKLSLLSLRPSRLVTKNIFSHSRLFRRQQVGRGKFSPLMAFDEAFGEWEARTGDCRSCAFVPPGQGLTISAADAQAITELALQGAWHRLRQRRQDKPDQLAPWHWLKPRKE